MVYKINHKNNKNEYRGWLYSEVGDYHKDLDLNWSYAPTYLQKVKLVKKIIESLPLDAKILDIGCGEGVFVENYAKQGRNIRGLDLNYESDFVKQGNILDLPYSDKSFDAIMLLDVFEHLAFKEQIHALLEIKRVLKDDGFFFASIPNLAHFNSRFNFALRGQLDRTDNEIDHCGERPFKENKQLFEEAGFEIVKNVGVTLTIPYIYRQLICRKPKRLRWLHDMFEPVSRLIPSLSMLTFLTCRKANTSIE